MFNCINVELRFIYMFLTHTCVMCFFIQSVYFSFYDDLLHIFTFKFFIFTAFGAGKLPQKFVISRLIPTVFIYVYTAHILYLHVFLASHALY